MRYRVFKLGKGGEIFFDAEGVSLGDGPRDLSYICEVHELAAGDVIYVADRYIRVEPGNEFMYLDLSVEAQVGGKPWGPEMAMRLYRMAIGA